jgi:hypothetical protein
VYGTSFLYENKRYKFVFEPNDFFLVKFPILKWTFELLVDLSEKFALPGTKAD